MIPYQMAPYLYLHKNTPKIGNGAKGGSTKTIGPFIRRTHNARPQIIVVFQLYYPKIII
jgi:hypothetical protein